MPTLSIYVAVSQNGVIGREGHMPWKLSSDLKRLKVLTMGKPLVLGRKTFESFGSRPLPGRPHVVVSRSARFEADGVETATTFDAALKRADEIARSLNVDEVCVLGGGEIYRQALPLAGLLHVTHVEAEFADGDAFFPAIDPEIFTAVQSEYVPAGEKDSHATRYVIYRRR
ncbi:dihydrofolate reductase [Allorhizobium sp. BGMRC 0089]|uniref:dihydrofolate reductase n=1 Tax=Allorhizobium sonneratiae TaxID=2934936 RepID=UPI0020334099|nr:dihydrofolate reductase [Allorhizobium sonneratiae]MCM2294269.1 dihydrofolate reductase [Allorhizobium sonneratiae]